MCGISGLITSSNKEVNKTELEKMLPLAKKALDEAQKKLNSVPQYEPERKSYFMETAKKLLLSKKMITEKDYESAMDRYKREEAELRKKSIEEEKKLEKEKIPSISVNETEEERILPEVLFVEDDPIAIDLTSIFLKNICRLDTAYNASAAIEKVNLKKYTAIIMDVNLGKASIDGVQTTRLIRQIDGYKDTPIIAITAFVMKGDKEEFLEAGCSHYLSKPFTRAELTNLMVDVLRL